MDRITFGFMDPSRSEEGNAELFVRMRTIAIQGFERETVCNLHSFSDDSVAECHEVLSTDVGKQMGALRDLYYEALSERDIPIRLPDIQAYFLYAFTIGVNEFSEVLSDPEEFPEPRVIPSGDVFDRLFPIRGPDWLVAVTNREMPFVENVFCDYQDEVVRPLDTGPDVDHRLLADVIAGTFVWAYFGGMFWLREVVEQLSAGSLFSGRGGAAMLPSMCQVKKTMQVIPAEDMVRVRVAQRIFKG